MPEILIILIKIVVIIFGFGLSVGGLLTMVERKQSSLIQNRIGPNRANIGPLRLHGFVHIVADAIKSFFKEDFVSKESNKLLHFLAPAIALFPSLVVFGVMPFHDKYCSGKITVINFLETCHGESANYFQIADIDAGILFIFAISSIGVYGVMIGGWASANKWSLLGAIRAGAQMISYEVAMGLSIMGILMVYGTVDLNEMVRQQGVLLWGFLPKWGIFVQPLGFLLFFTAIFAETKRAPFDLPEAESELVGGYFTEFSAMRFATFMFAEFVAIMFIAALMATLFFGGWQVPYLYAHGFSFSPDGTPFLGLSYPVVIGLRILVFIGKIVALIWLQFMIRWTLPRFRYDQLMSLGWKVLLPLSLANLIATGVIMLWV